ADRRLLAVDRYVHEALVAVDRGDHAHQPVVGQARHQPDAARRELVGDPLGDIRRLVVHGVRPSSVCAALVVGLRSARHTVSAVIGRLMSRTPRCHSASITALPIAAGAPIVPLSLPPLTPSGLLGAGVAMNAVWKNGRSAARGMA